MVLSAAAIHEAGHWVAIRTVRGRIRRLRLSAVGAELQLEGTLSYGQELVCALAGPAVSLITAFLTAKAGRDVFAGLNLTLGLFNLLPVSTLDGGRALNCVSEMLFGPDVAGQIHRGIDLFLSLTVLLGGGVILVSGGSVTLFLVAVWLLNRNKEEIILKNIKKILAI